MKKKNLVTMLLALTLVGAVGIGATLAYLSDSTGAMTNTFTVGSGIDMKQDEEDIDYDYDKDDDGKVDPEYDKDGDGKVDEGKEGRTEDGNDYTDIQPGDVLVKDPTVTIKANSTECYVFMQLTGADELVAQEFTFGGFDATKWIKVADMVDANEESELNGIYMYYETVKKDEQNDQVLAPLFTSVTYSIDAEAEDVELSDVVIKSCAVQAANMTTEAALKAANETINQ